MTLLKRSFPIAKKNGLFLTAYLITFIVIILLISTLENFSDPFPMLKTGLLIVYLLIGSVASFSIIRYTLQAIRGEELTIPNLKEILRFTINYLIGSMLLSLTLLPLAITAYIINAEAFTNDFISTTSSFVFLLVLVVNFIPYILVYIRFGFYIYILSDQPKRIDRALAESWQLTKGNGKRIFLLGLLCFGLLVAGILLLVVGIFPACILCYIVTGLLYNDMLQKLKIETTEKQKIETTE